MGHTLAEKIIMKHIGGKSVKPGDLVVVEPDCVVIHDIYTAFLQDKMKKMGLTKVWNTDKIVIMHDHLMPACLEGDPRSLEAGYELVKEYGIRHFHATGGIVHQLVPELGYSKPGDIVFVTDSHTPTYGAVGCFSTGVGYTEMAAVWGTGQMWLRVPSSIKIQIDGVLPPHVYAKDIILRVLGDLGAAGGTYKSLEFCGTAIDALGIDGRMTIANMVVECGGKAGLFAADQKCADYCGVDYEDVAWVKADEDAEYERVLTYKAEDLEPVLSCPPYLPEGLKESDKLPEPIYTPSTKAEIGDHDENISFEQSVEHLEKYYPGKGKEYAEKLRDYTITLYKKCAAYALEKGIIIADTKFEFGLDEIGRASCRERV